MNQYILSFWRACRERGEPERPIWAAIHDYGSTQPPGYMQTWVANKRDLKRAIARIPGKLRLIQIRPSPAAQP
jgi:hypothetical protein